MRKSTQRSHFPRWHSGVLNWNLILKAPYSSFLLDLLPESPLVDQSGLAPGDWSPRRLQVLFFPFSCAGRHCCCYLAMLLGGSGMGAHPVVLAYSEQVNLQLELKVNNSWFDANRMSKIVRNIYNKNCFKIKLAWECFTWTWPGFPVYWGQWSNKPQTASC